jgi:hypothetical protein
VILVLPTDASLKQTFNWMGQLQGRRKTILDTEPAAILHTDDARRLLTSDHTDFMVLNVFDVVTP